MRVIDRMGIIMCGAFLLGGCITPFTPEIEESVELMVINGLITDREGEQLIEVSRTSPFGDDQSLIPESNCIVEVQDNKDHIYNFPESGPGIYTHWMTARDLEHGTKYKVIVTTEDGLQYESEFEELLPCPPIDSIFWEIRERPAENPGSIEEGAQFFLATDATGGYAKSYRWELVETWEYNARFAVWGVYYGYIFYGENESDSIRKCWKTMRVNDFFTYSTRNLSTDHISKIPLNYVSNQTNRLRIKYSLHVKQFSLSSTAYEFWKNLEGQSKQSGELYESQPSRIKSNIRSLENPEETVLGFFSASSITEKRILMRPKIMSFGTQVCEPYGLEGNSLLEFLATLDVSEYPVYLYYVGGYPPIFDYAGQKCFDCRLSGGTLKRPDFWY